MSSNRARAIGWLLAAVTIICTATALWLFPKALPTIALKQELTRESAIERAREFATSHALPIEGARTAVRFAQDGETQTFIELEAGGKAAVNAEVNRGDVALFSWTVRFFRSGDPREVRVTLAPDGRIIGFQNTLAAADTRPASDSAQAVAIADSLRVGWLKLTTAAWRLVATSVETVQPSGRLDRTITWERTDRTLGVAPLRIDVTVRGDVAGGARQYVKVPETFQRRYAERRADNELYALVASLFVPVFALLGIAGLVGANKRGVVRWRPALVAGGVIGLALGLAQLNDIPGSYFGYDTALSPGTFLAQQWLIAVLLGIGMGLVSAVLLATGELLTREAFPHQYDWWQTTRFAGTRPVAMRVLGGYTLAAFGLAYVSVFYLLAERGLGWWSPSSLLDDPNQIATPFPWLTAVATSLQAGVLEEVLFRTIPIALVARAVGNRPWRPIALGASVVVTALVFGFAHANYPSFPAYARGVELFAEAVLWAVLYLRVGLVTTIVGHFTYDLILFGLFAAAGDAAPYRVTLGVVALVALLPAIMVAARAWRTRGLIADAPDEARFSAWRSMSRQVTAESEVPPVVVSTRSVGWVTALLAAAAVLLGLQPTSKPAPPPFTATRAQAIATADSLLRTLGAGPEGWLRLTDASVESWDRERRFLAENDSTKAIESRIANGWIHGGQWNVRYVHREGSATERTESWRIALGADGQPHTWSHIIADSAPAPTLPRLEAESAARAALVAAGASANALALESARETARPARLDVDFEFVDTSIVMPAKSSVRRMVTVSGDRVTRISHRVFLPEDWERANTARLSKRSTISFGAIFALALAGLVGLVRFLRRRPVMHAMSWPSRKTMIITVAAAGAVMMLLSANDWQSSMYAWNTASPFDRHQWTSALSLLGAALGPVLIWGLWLAADAVRRRAGVRARSLRARDAWLFGGVVALGPVLLRSLPAMFLPLPTTPPVTSLDQVLPAFDGIASAVSSALLSTPMWALAVGAALAIKSRVLRIVALTLAAVAVGMVTGATSVGSSMEWMKSIAFGATAFGLLIVLFWRYGSESMEAWFIGAVLVAATTEVTTAMLVQSGVDRLSHVLAALCALAVGAFVTSRPRGAADSDHLATPMAVAA